MAACKFAKNLSSHGLQLVYLTRCTTLVVHSFSNPTRCQRHQAFFGHSKPAFQLIKALFPAHQHGTHPT